MEGEEALVNIIAGNIHTLIGRSLQELKQLQVQDTHIGPVLCCLEKGEQPDTNNSRSLSPHTRRLIQQWDQLVLKDGVMWRRFEDKEGTTSILQLIIPQTLCEEV